jgi:hypothetical protein
MQLPGKVRAAVDQVTAAADNTRQAITVIGVLAAVALVVGLVALAMGSRRPAAARL